MGERENLSPGTPTPLRVCALCKGIVMTLLYTVQLRAVCTVCAVFRGENASHRRIVM